MIFDHIKIVMLKEFKEFATKGNIMDLAVGVIMGSAFGKIVTSLVDNILMPIIGVVTGGINFSNGLTIRVEDAVINYGIFIQNIIDFLIVSFCIFIMIKVVNRIIRHNEKEEVEQQKTKPNEIDLLVEIRDLLKEDAFNKSDDKKK